MNVHKTQPIDTINSYLKKIQYILTSSKWSNVEELAFEFMRCWIGGNSIFICGNGGSAGNANHLANDFLYGIARATGAGINIISLCANTSVLTCLANDIGYESIYSEQIAVAAKPGDLLLVLSGSGNSTNIVHALNQAKSMGVKTAGIFGFSGGSAKAMVDISIHFDIQDMQISEDMQLVVGHMIMQWLHANKKIN